MNFPPVDVIVPAFNAAATVRDAVLSVLAQTAPDLRVIVIDDGSTDGTAQVVNDLAARDNRVLLLNQPNGGIVMALNAGLERCTAPFVARLDADDMSAPDRHARQLQHLLANPGTVAVSGAHREIGADGSPTGRIGRPGLSEGFDPTWAPAREPQLTQPFFMARRDVLMAAGGYRPLAVSEDSDLYWRLAEHGRLDNLDAELGSYRMHAGSISSASIANGRLMALCSQLAALSACRRRDRRGDVVFAFGQAAAWRAAGSLHAMTGRAADDLGLDERERRWLAVATAAKLMELAGYRPFELEPQDCLIIPEALRSVAMLSSENRTELKKMLAATAARLLRLGRLRDATRVAPPSLWPHAAVRAGLNRLYWTKHLT
jgi:glycosyltransferase involved in cell wall biosynthesis